MKLRIALISLAVLFRSVLSAAALSGTRTIGPTGDYVSIGAAIADIQAQGLDGPLVLELQAAYVSSVETFPLTIPSLNGASAVNTVTVRPASGATNLSISSADTTAATVDLNGAQFLTIDGRSGGTGTAKQLTIANTSTAGVALRFINEASSNTIQYITLQGVNTSATSGTVAFSTTTGANGNDNNTIDHCDIRDGASTPANAIYSLGSAGTTAQNNGGNTVSNCNVFNFFAATAVDAAGLRLEGGNTDWTITGNSFYQTATRPAVAASIRAVYVNNTSGNNFTVAGNFIGGTSANAGGTAWTTTGTTVGYRFVGIHFNVGATMPSNVHGNTIRSMVWTSSSTASAIPGVWGGIYVQAGTVNIGTVSGNVVGSSSGTGSISVTTSGTGGTIYGICSPNGVAVSVVNNAIGSVTVNGSASTISASITGISVGVLLNSITVSGNIVGSTTTANSLNAATSSTSATGQQVAGILSGGNSGGTLIITGNTIANLNNNYIGTATTGQIRGIVTTEGKTSIAGNTVSNLSTTSNNPSGTTTSVSVLGIAMGVTAGNVNLSRNVVHSLSNSWSSGGVVTGIYYTAAAGGNNLIAGNLVHSLSGVELRGMEFGSGSFTAQNNMVRVGIGASGGTAGTSFISGIKDSGTTAGRKFYHNSVFVGGTPTAGSASTSAFGSTGTNNLRDYRNNMFVNARSNSGATSKHYAVIYGGTTANPAGLTAASNILYANGSGGVVGFYNSVDRTTLAAWQAATGQDVSSAVADPLFVNPTGTAATVDLHLQASNPAEGGGLALASVTDDFDGETRSSLTPVDIGADAGNLASSTGDIFAPAISYPLLTSASAANRVLTGWASIVDNSDTVSGGASAPRLYYKKSTDADVFGGNTSADNGWKYVTASNGSSPYSFTIDYSIVNGGSVSVGNAIQYFVVAQDSANNLGSSPAGAVASVNPPVQNINGKPAAGVNSYSIVSAFSGGTKTVGTGGDYPSLSGAGGLFAALNGSVVIGDLVINITSDLTETGSNGLNQMLANEYPPSATVTIQPASATIKTISGTVNGALIKLDGADRVTIDGRFGGIGRYLTLRNTSTGTSAITILFLNDACNNTVRSCIVEGATTALFSPRGVISLTTGTVTGNDNNLISDNQVRDLSTSAGVPSALLGSDGSSTAAPNSNNTFANNELFNFNSYGIYINGGGNESWTISGNNIYEVNASNGNIGILYGIDISSGGTNVVTGNYIHNLLTTGGQSFGIHCLSGSDTTISHNRVTALNVNPATTLVFGIYAEVFSGSKIQVVNNQITLMPIMTVSSELRGIYNYDTTSGILDVFYNTVLIGGTESGARNSWGSLRQGNNTHTSRDNIFFNNRSGGSGSHFAAGSIDTGGSYTASNNVYVGTGATPGNFMDFRTNGTPAPVTFTTWQGSIGGDANSSAGIAGAGNFTAAMFVNAATGDLHIIPAGNPLVSGTGAPIAGITTDYEGDARNAFTPDIGADEFNSINANLNALTLSAGMLSPVFDPNTTSYTADVSNATTAVTATPTRDEPNAVVTVNGTNSATPVALNVGTNTITVFVTAQDLSTTKTYTVTVTRRTVFQDWAVANNISSDPLTLGANGVANLLNFAFGVNPGSASSGGLQFTGNFITGGVVTATGLPITQLESSINGTDVRALFVRRTDYVSAGLTYTPQFAGILANWQDSTDTPTVLADDGTNQIVSVPFPSELSATGFFHLRVSLP